MKSISALIFILVIVNLNLFAQNIENDTIKARSIIVKSDSLSVKGLYDSSLHLLKVAETIYAKYKLEKKLIYTKLSAGRRYIDLGLFDSSLVISQKCYDNHRKVFNEDKMFLSWFYNIQGLSYEYKGDYNTALANYNSAYNIKLTYLDPNSIGIAQSFADFGMVYIYLGDFEKALDFLKKALQIKLKLLGEKNGEIADCYNNQAIAYYYLGDLSNSLKNFTEALNVRKALFGEIHPDVASSYINIANIEDEMGNIDIAIMNFNRALEIYKKVYDNKHYLIAVCLDNLGGSYVDKGDIELAARYLNEALKMRLEIFGEKHPQTIGSYNNLGGLFYNSNQSDKAFDFYKKALDLQLELYGTNQPFTIKLYRNIGSAYSSMQNYKKAIDYYKYALDAYAQMYGENHPDIADTYNDLGSTYYYQKDYDNALLNFKKSIQTRKRLSDPNEFVIANNYNSIGAVFIDTNKPDSAKFYLDKSYSVFKEKLGDKHPTIAMVLYNFGDTYTCKEDYTTAMIYYKKGLVSNIKDYSDTSNFSSLPPIDNSFSIDQRDQGLIRIAQCYFNQYKSAIDKNEKSRNLKLSLLFYHYCDSLFAKTLISISSEGDKMSYISKVNRVNGEEIQVCLEARKFFNDLKYNEYAFLYSERSKSNILQKSIMVKSGVKYAGIPDTLIQKEHNLSVDLAFYKQCLIKSDDSTEQIHLRSKVFNLKNKHEELLKTFENNYPIYYKLKYSDETTPVINIQKLLDKETAIRSYFICDSIMYIFDITRNSLNVWLANDIKGLDDSIQVYRTAILGDSRFVSHYLTSGNFLYSKLFPKEGVFKKGIKNLIIIPDGGLAFIPFESLPIGKNVMDNVVKKQVSDSLRGFKRMGSEQKTINFSNITFLIKQYNISYAYSAALCYQNFFVDFNEKKNVKKWLAITPVFSDKKEGFAASATMDLHQILRLDRYDTISTRGTLLNGDYVTPLPGTEKEVYAIQKEFREKGFTADVLLKNNANERTIKSGVLGNYSILHFATHGFVNSEKPELSGMLLAQDSTGGQDGVLYSSELYNLKLNADLTVLSACETGLGKVKEGEGIIGLTRALLYAGSKNIVVSLWSVSDQSTSDLMINFYKNLLNGKKGESYSKWLRDAKLRMIKDGKYSNPYYWSPFILIGR